MDDVIKRWLEEPTSWVRFYKVLVVRRGGPPVDYWMFQDAELIIEEQESGEWLAIKNRYGPQGVPIPFDLMAALFGKS